MRPTAERRNTGMSEPTLVASAEQLEIRSPMRPGMRVALAVIAAFPLIAPYELLVRVGWERYLHPFFFVAVLISAGAVALSIFLGYAAVAGLSSEILFDKQRGILTYSFEAPAVRRQRHVYALASVCRVETAVRDWSDGPATYHLRVILDDDTIIETGSSWSREDIEEMRTRVERFMADEIGRA